MTLRAWLGIAGVAAYVGVLVHTTAATQCPLRETGACARVHQLMMQARPPAPVVAALPMRAPAASRAPGAPAPADLVVLALR